MPGTHHTDPSYHKKELQGGTLQRGTPFAEAAVRHIVRERRWDPCKAIHVGSGAADGMAAEEDHEKMRHQSNFKGAAPG